MAVRIRAIVVISLTNLVIIMFSILTAIVFVKTSIEKSIESDISMVADIADHFISSEIESVTLKASAIVDDLTVVSQAEWPAVLGKQQYLQSDFIGAAVYTRTGELLVASGAVPPRVEIIHDLTIRRAFSGETVISSTCPEGDGVVFYMALPVNVSEGIILIVTLPGMYFSQRLSTFVIWETGHIFIDDTNGYVIANIRREWVQNRFNFIHMAVDDHSRYGGIADTVEKMVRGETGIARFSIDGVPRICAYRPVMGSNTGWCLGVIAPLPESPTQSTDDGLLIVGLVAFMMSIIAAVVASQFIKKPFAEIAALKEEAEANSQTKTQFLATMSHEMRTPLNAVIGLSELALNGDIAGEERDNIEKVYTAGVALLGIINDILDISKIESGKFELNPVAYDVPSLISDSVTLNSMRIGEKPIDFKLVVDKTLPSKFFGDDLRIKQIFNNLLSNAFKYTKAGIVQWRISWEHRGDDAWIVSSVIDSGIGIREEDIKKLFRNYGQVDVISHRTIEGTGLGLVLTKRLTELMDGSVSVESEYGKGSTFSIRIKQGMITDVPIGPAVAESLRRFRYANQKQSRNAQLVRIHLPYARVLVVDDISPNLTVVKGIMKPYGMRVDCVTSGEEAIKLIREGVRYNAIFMDHMMPGMDGIEAVRIIRHEIDTEYARTVPIIALTANAIRGNEEMFLKSGFQSFLSKPIDIVQMDAVIRQWVRSKAPDQDEAKIPGVDLAKVLDMFDGDEESLVELMGSYVKAVPPVIDRIRAFTQENLSTYIIDVHGLKGISWNISAEKEGSMAEALERAGKAGDVAYIEENNQPFIAELERLTADIQHWLDSQTQA